MRLINNITDTPEIVPYLATALTETLTYRTSRHTSYLGYLDWQAIARSPVSQRFQVTFDLNATSKIASYQATVHRLYDSRYPLLVPDYPCYLRGSYSNGSITCQAAYVDGVLQPWDIGDKAIVFVGGNDAIAVEVSNASYGDTIVLTTNGGNANHSNVLVYPLRSCAIMGNANTSSQYYRGVGSLTLELQTPRRYSQLRTGGTLTTLPEPIDTLSVNADAHDAIFDGRRNRGRRVYNDDQTTAKTYQSIFGGALLQANRQDWLLNHVLGRSLETATPISLPTTIAGTSVMAAVSDTMQTTYTAASYSVAINYTEVITEATQ